MTHPDELPYHPIDLHNTFRHQPIGSLFAYRTTHGWRGPLELGDEPIYALDFERKVWVRVRLVPTGQARQLSVASDAGG
jgi:hypothetical protein